jgi:hypothetical protein
MAWPDRSNSIRPKSLPAVVIASPSAPPPVDVGVVVGVAPGSASVGVPGVFADVVVDACGCAVWRALGSLLQLARRSPDVITVAPASTPWEVPHGGTTGGRSAWCPPSASRGCRHCDEGPRHAGRFRNGSGMYPLNTAGQTSGRGLRPPGDSAPRRRNVGSVRREVVTWSRRVARAAGIASAARASGLVTERVRVCEGRAP